MGGREPELAGAKVGFAGSEAIVEGIRLYKVTAVHESNTTGFVLCNSGQFGGWIQKIEGKFCRPIGVNIHSCLYVVLLAVL